MRVKLKFNMVEGIGPMPKKNITVHRAGDIVALDDTLANRLVAQRQADKVDVTGAVIPYIAVAQTIPEPTNARKVF